MSIKLQGDFNGLFATESGGTLLCLSHGDTAVDQDGMSVVLTKGMLVTAFDKDSDENGNPDDLIANGIVVESPKWLQCKGSRWALEIDDRGYYHESEGSNQLILQ